LEADQMNILMSQERFMADGNSLFVTAQYNGWLEQPVRNE